MLALQRMEERLRALHELRLEARLRSGFEHTYVEFLRSLRERIHPRGVSDVRSVQLADGTVFQVDLGDRLGCDVYYGYFDEGLECALIADALEPGATMLDVGANFGYFTVRCGQAVGPAGTVHAFEPDPSALALLSANVTANSLTDRVHIHAVAVSEADCQVAFHLAEESAFSGLSSTGRSATRGVLIVPARSLDSLCEEQGIDEIDALKIDVEGHEAEVLRGAERVLRRSSDPLIMLEVSTKNLTPDVQEALTAALDALIYDGYRGLVPDLSVDGGLRDVMSADDALGLTTANLFLFRPGRRREQRLRASVARRLAPGDWPVGTRPVREHDGIVRLSQGIDPELVKAALRDKLDLEGRIGGLVVEAGQLQEQIAALMSAQADLQTERSGLLADREALIADQGALMAVREALLADREALLADRRALRADKRALLADKRTLLADKRALLADREALRADKRALLADKRALLAEVKRLHSTPLGLMLRASRRGWRLMRPLLTRASCR